MMSTARRNRKRKLRELGSCSRSRSRSHTPSQNCTIQSDNKMSEIERNSNLPPSKRSSQSHRVNRFKKPKMPFQLCAVSQSNANAAVPLTPTKLKMESDTDTDLDTDTAALPMATKNRIFGAALKWNKNKKISSKQKQRQFVEQTLKLVKYGSNFDAKTKRDGKAKLKLGFCPNHEMKPILDGCPDYAYNEDFLFPCLGVSKLCKHYRNNSDDHRCCEEARLDDDDLCTKIVTLFQTNSAKDIPFYRIRIEANDERGSVICRGIIAIKCVNASTMKRNLQPSPDNSRITASSKAYFVLSQSSDIRFTVESSAIEQISGGGIDTRMGIGLHFAANDWIPAIFFNKSLEGKAIPKLAFKLRYPSEWKGMINVAIELQTSDGNRSTENIFNINSIAPTDAPLSVNTAAAMPMSPALIPKYEPMDSDYAFADDAELKSEPESVSTNSASPQTALLTEYTLSPLSLDSGGHRNSGVEPRCGLHSLADAAVEMESESNNDSPPSLELGSMSTQSGTIYGRNRVDLAIQRKVEQLQRKLRAIQSVNESLVESHRSKDAQITSLQNQNQLLLQRINTQPQQPTMVTTAAPMYPQSSTIAFNNCNGGNTINHRSTTTPTHFFAYSNGRPIVLMNVAQQPTMINRIAYVATTPATTTTAVQPSNIDNTN